MKLYTENVPGNLHQAAVRINDAEMADYVIAMDYKTGNYTVVVYRVSDDAYKRMTARWRK